MEPPSSMYWESVRDEQVKVFRTIPPLDPANVVRGQFIGYRQEPGVAPNSHVETFAAVKLSAGVLALGRRSVPHTRRQMPADYDDRSLRQAAASALAKLTPGQTNYFRFRLGPEISISLGAQVKEPGPHMHAMPAELSFVRTEAGRNTAPMNACSLTPCAAMRNCSFARMRLRPRGRLWIRCWETALHWAFTSRVAGVRLKPTVWPRLSAAGTISCRNRPLWTRKRRNPYFLSHAKQVCRARNPLPVAKPAPLAI